MGCRLANRLPHPRCAQQQNRQQALQTRPRRRPQNARHPRHALLPAQRPAAARPPPLVLRRPRRPGLQPHAVQIAARPGPTRDIVPAASRRGPRITAGSCGRVDNVPHAGGARQPQQLRTPLAGRSGRGRVLRLRRVERGQLLEPRVRAHGRQAARGPRVALLGRRRRPPRRPVDD